MRNEDRVKTNGCVYVKGGGGGGQGFTSGNEKQEQCEEE